MVTIYVSPSGSDSWSGRLASPNRTKTDGPVATLERARDMIRQMRSNPGGLPKGGVVVYLRGGCYWRSRPFELTSEDSGTLESPIKYRAYRREEVRLIGGKRIPSFQPVRDPQILNRLPEAARGKVVQADLKALGISDFGSLRRRGFGIESVPAAMELFYQGKPMQLARWPNSGWLRIADVPAGQQGGRFGCEGDRPKNWQNISDIWVHGYWTWDWADSYEKIASIDTDKRVITTVEPHGVYGYTKGRRFYFLNILEELDEPGEWYLDRSTGILYFWPPDQAANAEALVSILEAPLVTMNDVSYVSLEGITFEASRGLGVQITGGTENLIAGCTFRNLGTSAVVISGGTKHGVVSCDIYNVGEGGIHLSGGDRKTLTPGEHFAVNNHIHHYSRWCRTYRPAVSINGVGCRVANNLIHDAPHNAIAGGGNEHIVEYNEIYRVCLETGDAGAFYMGRDLTQRGNIVRYNYFHDLKPVVTAEGAFTDVMAVYLDDCFCGTTVYGNVFLRAGRAVMIGGGRDNTVENNIFIQCNPAIHVDARGRGWASFWFDGRDPTLMDRLKAVNHTQPPYSTRYPELANILNDDPAMPKGNKIIRNICVGGKWIEFLDGLNETIVLVKDNLVDGDPGFVDIQGGNFHLKKDSPALKLGFKQIPLEKIGLRTDRYRLKTQK